MGVVMVVVMIVTLLVIVIRVFGSEMVIGCRMAMIGEIRDLYGDGDDGGVDCARAYG